MEPLLFVLIALVLVVLFVLSRNSRKAGNLNDLQEIGRLKQENDALKIQLAKSDEKLNSSIAEKSAVIDLMKEEQRRLMDQLREERERLEQTSEALQETRAFFRAQEQKITEQKAEIQGLREKFNLEFEVIASKILDEKSQKFTEINRNNLDSLLNPLKENIKAFEDKVERVYKSESDERNVLKGELSKLMELNKQISEEAQNLTRALKTDTKKQGNWGEVVLDRILEASGLIKGESYIKQTGFTDENGNRLQPDVVITLPDNKHIIVDSKVSLVAYEQLVNCSQEDERKLYIQRHLTSIRNHITGLCSKNYHDLYKINSPDFVLLFIPIESSFAIAVQNDQDLFEFAWSKRVVVVTPSTLLATLKTVAAIWKQEQQTRNAIDIAAKAGALYDKFVGFIGDLKKIGDSIDKAKSAYSDAFGKLSSGNGNLIVRVENLKKLGAKASKQIETSLIEEE